MPRPDPRPWPNGRRWIDESGQKRTIRMVRPRVRHVCERGHTWDLYTDEGQDAPDLSACPMCGQAVTTEQEV